MTTNLLIFFAIPLAVIIFSIAIQKILRNPFLVAGIIFSVLLIIVLAFFDTIFLIAVVAYTILSFVTALLTCLICRFLRNQICNGFCDNDADDDNSNNGSITTVNMLNSGLDEKQNTTYNGFSGVTGNYVRCYNRRR